MSLFCFSSAVQCQNSFEFNFDGCSLSDSQGNVGDITPNTLVQCVCGVEADGLDCDGSNVFYQMDDLTAYFSLPEYTFEFDFLAKNNNQVQALFSVMKDCSKDSMVAFQYIPQDNEVELVISRIIGDSWTERGAINPDLCWHHVAFTKSGSEYVFYVDYNFVGAFDNLTPFPVHPQSVSSIGFSPCVVAGTDNTFNGVIDNVIFTPTVKTGVQLSNENSFVDLILNNDTTIVQGEAVQIFSGASCSSTVDWNPTSGIDDPSQLEPLITPDASTTYYRTLTHNGCTMTDSVRINVFDPADLDCSKLLMPNIFTPNGDNTNDRYGIANDFIIDELLAFSIFSRWGELLFTTNSKGETWDGIYKDTPAMSGMYMYQVDYLCGGQEQTARGSFGLMR